MSNKGGGHRHREGPMRRKLPSGKVVWLARYTGPDGRCRYWKPDWNRDRATFELKREAQRAIDEAYDFHERHGSGAPETVGAYCETWTDRHPRGERTNATNEHRISRLLDVELEGRPLRDWPFRGLKRRHALALLDHMLRVQGRSRSGAVNVLRALSVMAEDAITDEIAEVNFVKGVRVRATDPRISKRPAPKRVFTFAQMHKFAAAAAATKATERGPVRDWQALVRTFCDTGMRLGEVLPLERSDVKARGCDEPSCRIKMPHFHIRRTAHNGEVFEGTKNDHEEAVSGRAAPCPPTLLDIIQGAPRRIDTPLLFPTPSGRLWRERNFYRDVWHPTVHTTRMECTPHEFRHSYITLLRAAGVGAPESGLELVSPNLAEDERIRDWWATCQRLTAGSGTIAASLRMMLDFDITSMLPQIHAPTLVMHAQEDLLIPLAAGQDFAARLPNAQLVQLPGGDHIYWLGDQNARLETIRSFLADLPAGAPIKLLRRRRHVCVGWESLTPAELDVAALVGEGMTNREIAQRLYVSPRTVQTHIKHVLEKLGATRRSAIAAEAARRATEVDPAHA
jgi:DNA-binding CsgD family transcriptional regulator/integrase